MKSLFAVLLTACLCMSVKGEDSKPPRTLPGGWVYVWGDEFNGSRIDAKKWKPELGVIRNQGSQQTYTGRPKNMRLEDGCLVLETHFEKFANVNYKKSSADWIKNTKFMPYTSGSVTTIKTKNFMFGRLEVRAKVPKTKGIWPAIWLLGKNKWGWPVNGEIDMLENISMPEFMLKTEDGTEVKASDLTADGKHILMFLEEEKEPTEHILNEMMEQEEAFAGYAEQIIFVVRSKEALETPTLSKALAKLKNIQIYYDDFSEIINTLGRRMYVDPDKLPLIIVTNGTLNGIYATSGYNVGTGDMLLRLM